MPTPETLGKRILRARLQLAGRVGRPITQQWVAGRLRVTSVTVGRWEKDQKEPSLHTITQLAKVLGVTPEYLAFGTDVIQPVSLNVNQLPIDHGADVPITPGKLPGDLLDEFEAPRRKRSRTRGSK